MIARSVGRQVGHQVDELGLAEATRGARLELDRAKAAPRAASFSCFQTYSVQVGEVGA